VAFYAQEMNPVLVKESRALGNLSLTRRGYLLALEREHFEPLQSLVAGQGWLVEKEFTDGSGDSLVVPSRSG